MTPTIEQVMRCYRIVAQTERMKTGRPGAGTVANTLHGTTKVCNAAGVELTELVTALTRKKIDIALAAFMNSGLSRLTAWSYVCQLRGLFAKWCRPYFADAGWKIPPLDIPAFRAQAPRYVRPTADMLARVKAWYGKLKGEHWFAATMMLEYLNYTPHKTELSSGRRVCWPIHEAIWSKFDEYGGLACLDVTDETFNEINRELRLIGFRGHKASYELRKICIDHIYQKYGAETAVSISGDDIKTITRYYADPAQPNIGAVRIIDLL